MKDDKLKPRTVLTSAGYIADEDDDVQVYQRPWVDLTHQETKDCMNAWDGNDAYVLCRAIEAKLKEKNGL
jgi:hypothetical protein